jgi:hypothetical protein
MPHQYNMGLTPEGSFIYDVNLQNWTCPAKSVRASEKKLAHYCECDVMKSIEYTFHDSYLSLEIVFIGVWHKFFLCE